MLHNSKTTRIMVFGTFDLLHPGHLHFFRQARKLAKRPFLIVSLARDKNVKKIKGRLPDKRDRQRLAEVKKSPLVDLAVLGALGDHLPHILRQRPEIIALGFDQKAYVKNIKSDLKRRGLSVKIIRLKPYKREIYRSSLLKKR